MNSYAKIKKKLSHIISLYIIYLPNCSSILTERVCPFLVQYSLSDKLSVLLKTFALLHDKCLFIGGLGWVGQ